VKLWRDFFGRKKYNKIKMENHRTNMFKNKGKDQDVSDREFDWRVRRVPLA
jgi:hypothetical protein